MSEEDLTVFGDRALIEHVARRCARIEGYLAMLIRDFGSPEPLMADEEADGGYVVGFQPE